MELTSAFPARPVLTDPPAEMSAADRELLAAARDLLTARYRLGRHEVAAALRTADGAIHLGLHVEASAGRASVCAEGVALGAALVRDGGSAIVSAVSVVRRPGGSEHLIEPCGACAELLSDYAPEASIWLAVAGEVAQLRAAELLPAKHFRAAKTEPISEES